MAFNIACIFVEKQSIPADGVTKNRYITWYNEYIETMNKPTSKYDEDMPYLSGEVIYKFGEILFCIKERQILIIFNKADCKLE